MSNSLVVINRTILNADGQPLPGVTVAVLVGTINGASPAVTTTQPGTPLATLYADPQAAIPIHNPSDPSQAATLAIDGLGNLGSLVNGVFNIGVWLSNTGYGGSNYFVLQIFGPGVSQQQLVPCSFPSGGGGA